MAARLLAEASLLLGPALEADNSMPRGSIINQDPTAGTKVAPNSTVSMTLASGLRVRLPEVVGLGFLEASCRLRDAGLQREPVIVQCTLLVYVDDATSRLMHLKFVETEATFDYLQVTREYSQVFGMGAEVGRACRGDDPVSNLEAAKVFEDRISPGDWRVEKIDDDGGIEVAIFAGPQTRIGRLNTLDGGTPEILRRWIYRRCGALEIALW